MRLTSVGFWMRLLRIPALAAVCAVGLTLFAVGVSVAARDELDLVSRTTGVVGAKGTKASGGRARISANARYVAFQSQADNLVAGDVVGNGIFVRDRQSATTTLASRVDGPTGAPVIATDPAISGDGRTVTFRSAAPNVVAGDAATTQAIYARDVTAGTTTLVSRATGATGTRAGAASSASISADGRLVAFATATSLDPADTGTTSDVYVRDRQLETTMLASRATGPTGPRIGGSSPAISADGRYVAFQDGQQIRVRDLQAGITDLVSIPSGPTGVGLNGTTPEISADGRYVVFASTATSLTTSDPDPVPDVFVRDRAANTTMLVSRSGSTKGNGASTLPSISTDGRYVTFQSAATNLDPADSDATLDVYLHDVQAGATMLVSRAGGGSGVKGDASSGDASVSADGGAIVFGSMARNLHPADLDALTDVYVRDVTGGVPNPPPPPPPSPPPPPPPSADPAISDSGNGSPSLVPGFATGSSLVDGDGDGIPDASDDCPGERANARDANGNGCLDLLRLTPTFEFTPGRYVRLRTLAGGRRVYVSLGVSVRSVTASGLPPGATVELQCTRGACRTQRSSVGSRGKVTFRRLRGRRLRSGVNVTIVARQPGAVGSRAVYVVRRNALRKAVFCVRPGPGASRGSCSTLR